MTEILTRVWEDLIGRVDGPLHFRLILQPTMAATLAIRAGLRDAREGRPPLFSATAPTGHRREFFAQGLKDTRTLLIVAATLDVIYQLIVHRRVYLLELLITVAVLGIVPYVLVRGPVNRVMRMTRYRSAKQPLSMASLENGSPSHDPAKP